MGNRRWLFGTCCAGWAAVIFATSSTVVTPHGFFRWIHEHIVRDDAALERFNVFWGVSWFAIVKGWHVTEFAVLMLLAVRAVDMLKGVWRQSSVAVAALACLAYAAADEWHQTFVPGRGGMVSDVLIDSLGVLLVAAWLNSRRRLPLEAGGRTDQQTGDARRRSLTGAIT